MSVVLDASAILAFIQDEPGADIVEAALGEGAVCGAASWCEVAQKVRSAGRDWDLVRALLDAYELEVEPVLIEDAEWAARHWTSDAGVSLADRLCLALGDRFDSTVLTADMAWGSTGRVTQIR